MSKNRKQDKKQPWEVTFIRCDLDKQAKLELKSWNLSPSEILEKVEDMVVDGYKITFSLDERNSCVAAYATAKNSHPVNPQMCLDARGISTIHALKALLFKHYVLLEQTWGNRERTIDNDEMYG